MQSVLEQNAAATLAELDHLVEKPLFALSQVVWQQFFFR